MLMTLRKALASPLAISLIVGALVALAVLGLRSTGYLEAWELAAYDWSIRLQPAGEAESRVVLIGIEEQDIRALGQWPLTDATMAESLQRILRGQPRAIGVDIYRDFSVPPGRDALESVLTAHQNIIMVMKFGRDKQTSVGPPAILKETDRVGFNDLLVDRDGIVRRALLFMGEGERQAYSFPLRLTLHYLSVEGITPQPDPSNPEHLRLGPTTLRPLESNDGGYVGADARGYQILLAYRGAGRPLPSYPLSAVLAGRVDLAAIRDKIVLIGVMAESVPDLVHTPYSTGVGMEERGVYGVLAHAQMVSQLLRAALDGHSPKRTATERHEMWWIVLWGLLGAGVGIVALSTWRFVCLTAAGLVLLGGLVQLAFLRGWWIPVVPPAMAWLSSAALVTAYVASQEKRQRALVMQLFSRHVSPELADVVWQQRDQFLDGGRPRSQKVIVTVLFTDMEGFTQVSEKLDPQTLMDWTNAYMEVMAHVVKQHGGFVDDYIGDAIKADFGVPVARTTDAEIRQDAVNAVKCALAMERELRRLNKLWREQGLPSVRMRVGIFTGPAVAGSQGSAERLKFTTLGDTVNTAARLESFEKDSWEPDATDSPCRIFVGEPTVRYLDHRYRTQCVGEVRLKGKDEKVTVYRVVGDMTSEISPVMQEEEA
jgi:adenylate cyclase